MNYKKIYNLLCDRAKTREKCPNTYYEKHHIMPRCIGGTDGADNISFLTPEEHYVAHQLLVKIYPNNSGLIWAAHQMTKHPNGARNNNKLYGWLRRLNQHVAKKRTGNKNGSFGKQWFYNPESLENIKCEENEVPLGFVKGRYTPKRKYACHVCGRDTGSRRRKYCDEHREQKVEEAIKKASLASKNKFDNDENHKSIMLNNLGKGRSKGIKRPRLSERRP